ncbi:MAG: AraC family transcriptional regulator [Rubrivivax sp.]|nr:AraC family transcriptional regulator [Rubrivivax sp.]
MPDPAATLLSLTGRMAAADGTHATAWPGLSVVRASAPAARLPALYEPGLVFVLQGRKEATLGSRRHVYGPLHYLVVSLTSLPLAQVVEASPGTPYLCLRLSVEPGEIADLAARAGAGATATATATAGAPRAGTPALQVAAMTEALTDALLRLVRLLDSPADLPVLAPLAVREIVWRALVGELGAQLRALSMADSHAARIARAIEVVKARFDEPLRVDDLAAAAHMSASSLHHHFRQLTTLSPLQYQKHLRLHHARQLLMTGGVDAATAAHRVGYESPSHFSRDYRRLFGAPPRADAKAARPAELSVA